MTKIIYKPIQLNVQDAHRYYGSLQGVENSTWVYVHNTFCKEDLLNLTNFIAVHLSQFLTDFSQILDFKSYDQV